ncbi:MAG: hypothetical protein EOO01_42200 [Chitinophagaceae bacterium]|nr:MAG: hypothetical protein EOO01_42200 [Chitinophagaceae bacterium]
MNQADNLLYMLLLCLAMGCSQNKNSLPCKREVFLEGVVTPADTPIASQTNKESIEPGRCAHCSSDDGIIVTPSAEQQAHSYSSQRIIAIH